MLFAITVDFVILSGVEKVRWILMFLKARALSRLRSK
jgi:hypothetical protein